MRRRLALGLGLLMPSLALAQGFAPPQPRAVEFRMPSLRFAPALNLSDSLGDSVSASGLPQLVPAGLGPVGLGTMGASVWVPGMNIQIPASAGTNPRMLVVANSLGGMSTILYNPSNGAIVEYQQSLQVDTRHDPNAPGTFSTGVFAPGMGSQFGIFAGYSNVTINPVTGGIIGPNPGIPAINNLRPSYDYRQHPILPAATPPGPFDSSSGGSSAPLQVGLPLPSSGSSPPP